MKKLIYLLLLPLVVAVTACGGKVNSKKESVLATQDSVDARGIQRMQTSKSEIDIKFKGKSSGYTDSRRTGTGDIGRSKCSHAQSVATGGTEKVYLI